VPLPFFDSEKTHESTFYDSAENEPVIPIGITDKDVVKVAE
jgi:hypothetical protein